MSDQTANDDTQTEDTPDELSLLKKRATTLGISFHPSIGLDSLKKKVADKLSGEPEASDETGAEAPAGESKAEAAARQRRELRADALKLIRLRITNLNPDKKELHGEIFTVANKFIGDVKKYIPYGEASEDGYHVPNVIYKQMKARKFLQVKTRKDPRRPGHMLVDQKWVPEFALEVLPQLTQEELEKLATAQAAAGSTD